jgi:hypothetical protein
MAAPRPLSKRLAVTAGYATAALAIAAVSPVARRHPVHATAVRAAGQVRTVRSGLDLWLDLRSSPPPTLGELLTEAVLGALASRPTSD